MAKLVLLWYWAFIRLERVSLKKPLQLILVLLHSFSLLRLSIGNLSLIFRFSETGVLEDMKLVGYVQISGSKIFVSHKISVFVSLFFGPYPFCSLSETTLSDDRSFLFRVHQKKVKRVRILRKNLEKK